MKVLQKKNSGPAAALQREEFLSPQRFPPLPQSHQMDLTHLHGGKGIFVAFRRNTCAAGNPNRNWNLPQSCFQTKGVGDHTDVGTQAHQFYRRVSAGLHKITEGHRPKRRFVDDRHGLSLPRVPHFWHNLQPGVPCTQWTTGSCCPSWVCK